MNPLKYSLIVALTIGLAGFSARAEPSFFGIPADTEESQPAEQAAAVEQRPAVESSHDFGAITSASNPSGAIDAYARAQPGNEKNPDLYAAFIRKMIDFRLPQMAEEQAQALLKLRADDGLALAVMSFVDAQANDMPTAFAEMQKAARNAPNEPFVQTTAGQLVAWLDSRPDQSAVTDRMRQIARDLRSQLGDSVAFSDAYKDGMEALKGQAAPNESANTPYDQSYGSTTVAGGYGSYDTAPYVYTYSYPYAYSYYSYGYPFGYGSPYFYAFPVVVFDGHHRHHHGEFVGHHRDFMNNGSNSGLIATQARVSTGSSRDARIATGLRALSSSRTGIARLFEHDQPQMPFAKGGIPTPFDKGGISMAFGRTASDSMALNSASPKASATMAQPSRLSTMDRPFRGTPASPGVTIAARGRSETGTARQFASTAAPRVTYRAAQVAHASSASRSFSYSAPSRMSVPSGGSVQSFGGGGFGGFSGRAMGGGFHGGGGHR